MLRENIGHKTNLSSVVKHKVASSLYRFRQVCASRWFSIFETIYQENPWHIFLRVLGTNSLFMS